MTLFEDLFLAVKDHMKWDDAKTRLWFNTENPLCGNLSPDEFIARRPEKAASWIESLIEENSVGGAEG